MYLRKSLILQSGSLQDLELDFDFNEDESPKPVIIVGRNGSGKSNFLSYITDALIEIAAKKFGDVAPQASLGGHLWHRQIGASTIRIGSAYELSVLKFTDSDKIYNYVSKGGELSKEELSMRLNSFGDIPNWDVSGSFKVVSGSEDLIEHIYRNGCYVSFLPGRTESPYWSSTESAEENSSFVAKFSHQLKKPIAVGPTLSSLKPWLIDVLLDQSIDIIDFVREPEKQNEKLLNYLKNTTTLSNFNKILQKTLQISEARLVRTGRNSNNRKLIVMNGNDTIVPSLDNFSSGQSSLIAMFGTILRYADSSATIKDISKIEGIALIDEIDNHLHANLQYNVLPELIKLFPKVQFIVSSHSPLFSLGMERTFGESRYTLLELPEGSKINAERFSEFINSFNYLKNTKLFTDTLADRVSLLFRPLVICEGQTDPKYLRTAATMLNFQDLASNVDFDWIGVIHQGQARDGGEGQLRQAKNFLKIILDLIKNTQYYYLIVIKMI